jgi:hypothetical protein
MPAMPPPTTRTDPDTLLSLISRFLSAPILCPSLGRLECTRPPYDEGKGQEILNVGLIQNLRELVFPTRRGNQHARHAHVFEAGTMAAAIRTHS